MTADKLHKMQQEAKQRHSRPFFVTTKEEPLIYIEAIEAPKTLSQLIDESYEFRDGDLKPVKKERKIEEKIILPDLMTSEIPLSCTSDKKTEPTVMKNNYSDGTSIFDKLYVPNPVQKKEKRPYVHFTALPPDPPKQRWERPKAQYSNSPSPFGIYDELKKK